jgi:hypothetical protein
VEYGWLVNMMDRGGGEANLPYPLDDKEGKWIGWAVV